MKYNFDEIINRKDTNSKKWNSDLYKSMFGGYDDLLPLWIADMDFKVARPILDAMQGIIDQGVLGYTAPQDEFFNSTINWHKKRKDIDIKKEWLVYTNGVVPALGFIIQTFTNVGDNILIQTPSYPPFAMIPTLNDRNVITNPLKNADGYYTIDFEDIEKKIVDENIKIFILCNPHNPTGRVWSGEDLVKIGDICLKHNVFIISDEIHSDLVYGDKKFTSFLSLGEKYHKNLFVCTAPSKTFNLAGLQVSLIVIPDIKLNTRYRKSLGALRIESPNSFAIAGLTAGYTYGEEWLEQVLDYLDSNRKFIQKFLEKNLPLARYTLPEGTYLAWIDLSKYFKDRDMIEFFEKSAKVAIDYGSWFGDNYKGYIRLNFACPRSILEEALNRIYKNL